VVDRFFSGYGVHTLSTAMRFGWLEVAALTAISVANAQELAFSPPFYPSPWADGQGEWADAHRRAVEIVSQMTLAEKVNLTTGTGWVETFLSTVSFLH
jgi:beta-glucosidase